jgi:hypothetical protein
MTFIFDRMTYLLLVFVVIVNFGARNAGAISRDC